MLSKEEWDRWNELFREDNLEELLREMISHPEINELAFDCQNLQSQLEAHNKKKRQGVISNEEYDLVRNRIRLAIQQLTKPAELVQKHKGIPPSITYLGWLFSALIVGGMVYLMDKCFSNLPPLPPPTTYKAGETLSAFPYPVPSTETLKTFKFSGEDTNGKRADYIIYLVRGFNWRIGEVAVSEDNGEPFDICHHLTGNGISARINNDSLQAIICFGNTSFEEDLSIAPQLRLKKEEDRASERAEELAQCVNSILGKLTPVYTLNLGKYLEEDDDSRYQREIIIIGLIGKEKGVVEEEALFEGLLTEHWKGNLDFDIQQFSRVTEEELPLQKRFN